MSAYGSLEIGNELDSAAKESLLEPYSYIAGIPGKGVRPVLIEALQLWLCIPEDKLEEIKEIVQMLHNASLL